ncbi:MAG TPA: hypothetical protein VFJ17_10095 [Mycobacteriales bacterium]|nr:hypothetical protein [Mycobacteriales bacterium]
MRRGLFAIGLIALTTGVLSATPAQARWWPPPTLTVSASADSNGLIYPSGTIQVSPGQSVTFYITPNANYHVSNVTVDYQPVGAVTKYTLTKIQTNHVITAYFALNPYFTIKATANSGGAISPSGTVTVTAMSNITYTLAPKPNYHVSDLLVDSVSQGPLASYTFNQVRAPHTIEAVFAIDQFTIASSAGPGGTISPSGAVVVDYGTSQAFRIAPDTGFRLTDVQVDGQSVGPVTRYSFDKVATNHSITATFLSYYKRFDISGAIATTVTGLDNTGRVVGFYQDGTGIHGFVDQTSDAVGTNATSVDVGGSGDTRLTAVNDAGTATGCTRDADGHVHGFLRSVDGTITALDESQVTFGTALEGAPPPYWHQGEVPVTGRDWAGGICPTGINSGGVVVGYYTGDNGTGKTLHGFVLDGTTFTTYDDPDTGTVTSSSGLEVMPTYFGTVLFGINTGGVTVGSASYVSTTDPLLGTELGIVVNGSTLTTYEWPASGHDWCDYTEVASINDSGTLVGNMGLGCGPGDQHAWLLASGGSLADATPINYVDAKTTASSTRVFTVNNSGQIGGMWIDSHGHDHGYIADQP